MIDHLGIGVTDFGRSKAFYLQALAPLGIGLIFEPPDGDAAGFGAEGKPFFWIGAAAEAGAPTHVAFTAGNRALVDAFYAAAMAAGGRDNGAPGIREHYHPNYYGAFVLDPDGHNIEAVCHLAE
jgi:catechol 2,3-dioxygenase-like lactoylglutathione lyase family enzyme